MEAVVKGHYTTPDAAEASPDARNPVKIPSAKRKSLGRKRIEFGNRTCTRVVCMRLHAAGIIFIVGLASAAELPSAKEVQRKATSKGAIAGSVAGAGIQQARNSPHEWGSGWAGFGKRLGSTFGKSAVKNGIKLTVGTIRDEELSYRPSGKQGFKPRVKYALLSTVITRKKTTGKKTFASGEVSGAVGAGFISRLWQPARLHTVSSGIGSAGISLGVDAGLNVTREFWPEIRHPKRARENQQSTMKK